MLPAFKTDFQREKNGDVRIAYAFAIARLGDRAFLDSLVLALGGSGSTAGHARDLLLELGPGIAPDLYPYLNDRDPSVRGAVCDLLADLRRHERACEAHAAAGRPQLARWPTAPTARSRSCARRARRPRSRDAAARSRRGGAAAAPAAARLRTRRRVLVGRRGRRSARRGADAAQPSDASTTCSHASARRPTRTRPISRAAPGPARPSRRRCRRRSRAAPRPRRAEAGGGARARGLRARRRGATRLRGRAARRSRSCWRRTRSRRVAARAAARARGAPPVPPPDPLVARVLRSYGDALQADLSGTKAAEGLIDFATRAGRPGEADAAFQELVRRRREDPALLVRYGDFLAGPGGKPEAALAQYAQALIWKPDDDCDQAEDGRHLPGGGRGATCATCSTSRPRRGSRTPAATRSTRRHRRRRASPSWRAACATFAGGG